MTASSSSPAASAAKKQPAKKAAAKKTPAKASTDVISDTANTVENLDKTQALNEITQLLTAVDETYFRLGGILARVQENSWWADEGFESFKDFLAAKHGFAYRKAMYLIQIYKDVVNSGVNQVQVAKIGWTKLKEISHLLTQDNVEEWIKRAEEMTTLKLQAYVKALASEGGDDGDKKATTASSNVSTKTFKLHNDQRDVVDAALEHKKKAVGTEVDTVALTGICEEYLAQAGTTKAAGVTVEGFKSLGYEAVLEVLDKAFPEIDIEVSVPDDSNAE